MILPVQDVVLPAALHGVANGRLPPGVLAPVSGRGGRNGMMQTRAALAWAELTLAANAIGVTLTATSSGDFYRSLEAQTSLFLQRYSATYLPGRPTKQWEGRTYWQRVGVAEAATPGTSNHGWGLAVDIAEWNGGPQPLPLSNSTLMWLSTVGVSMGWSAELQNEPWHWRWVAGDATPVPPTPPVPATPALQEDIMALTAIGSACRRMANGRQQFYDAHANDDGTWTIVGQNQAPMTTPTGEAFGNKLYTIPHQQYEFRGLVPAKDHGGVIACFGQGITIDIQA